MLTRRQIVVGAAAAGAILRWERWRPQPLSNWRKTSPTDAGFAPDMEARLENLISSGRAWKQHGVVVAAQGRARAGTL